MSASASISPATTSDRSALNLPTFLSSQIPQDETSQEALRLAITNLPPPILNHSLRVYFYAHWLATKEGAEWATPARLPLLFVACVMHDLGASVVEHYTSNPDRFEVAGADAAEQLLIQHGWAYQDVAHRVWIAIATHTCSGIAERIDSLARLLRISVLIDFTPSYQEDFGTRASTKIIDNATPTAALEVLGAEMAAKSVSLGHGLTKQLEEALPRLQAEKILADAVVAHARFRPAKVDSYTYPDTKKHPSSSWPGCLLRAAVENPGYDGINPAF